MRRLRHLLAAAVLGLLCVCSLPGAAFAGTPGTINAFAGYECQGNTIYCGDAGDGGPATSAAVGFPEGVATDAAGNVFIAEAQGSRVRFVPAASCTSNCPYGFTGPLTAGDAYTFAGNGTAGYSGEGVPRASSQLALPDAVVVDPSGNVLIADNTAGSSASNMRIQMVAGSDCASNCPYGLAGPLTKGDMYTVAGNGTQGNTGQGGPAPSAELGGPNGLAVDSAGNLLISESGDGALGVEIIPSTSCTTTCRYGLSNLTAGYIYTVAGGGSSTNPYAIGTTDDVHGDGTLATQVEISPRGVAVDGAGNLLISDDGELLLVPGLSCSTDCPYDLGPTSAGGTYLVAGAEPGYVNYVEEDPDTTDSGIPGTTAGLRSSYGITVDPNGDVIYAGRAVNNVRMIAAYNCSSSCPFGLASMVAGDIYSVAGTGTEGYSGDGGPALQAELDSPTDVATDPDGNLYIADEYNNRVRSVSGLSDPIGFGSSNPADTSGQTNPNYPVIISEVRLDTPSSAPNDRYVDLANLTDAPVSISGWQLQVEVGQQININTLHGTIPAFGHFLVADTGYASDAGFGSNPADETFLFPPETSSGSGVLLLKGNGDVADAVGFVGATAGYFSGTAMPDPPTLSGPADGEFAFARKWSDGLPVNTLNNAKDFQLLATDAANDVTDDFAAGAQFGAPAPFGTGSPTNVNDGAQSTALDPNPQGGALSCGSSLINTYPNCEYDPSTHDGPDGGPTVPTLIIRRTITNCFGADAVEAGYNAASDGAAATALAAACANAGPGAVSGPEDTISKLGIQLTSLSTYGSPGSSNSSQALLIGTTSIEQSGFPVSSGSADVKGTSLDSPPSGDGGGVDSTFEAGLPSGGLLPGASVDISIEFLAERAGTFDVGYNTLDDLEPYTGPVLTPPTTTTTTTPTDTTPTDTTTGTTTTAGATTPASGSPTPGSAAPPASATPVDTGVLGGTAPTGTASGSGSGDSTAVKVAPKTKPAPASIRLGATTVTRGRSVKLSGTVGGLCPAGAALTVKSAALRRPAHAKPITANGAGRYAVTELVPARTKPGQYAVKLLCGTRTAATTQLRVVRAGHARTNRTQSALALRARSSELRHS